MPNEQKAVERKNPWMEQLVTEMNREDRLEQLRNLLGSEAAVERFKTVALHAIISDSKLQRVNPLSLIEAVRESAVLGLEPTGILGEAYILPYGTNAELRIGWAGYLKLIRNSGQVAAIDCQVVYEKDDFQIQFGTDPRIEHKPYLLVSKDDQRGDYKGAYAWARLANGQLLIEWMPTVEIERARKFSQAKSGPWFDWWGEMARKTVIRRFAKRMPKSAQLQRAMEIEAELDDLEREAQPAPMSAARSAAMAALDERFPTEAEEAAFDEGYEVAREVAAAAKPQDTDEITDEELENLTRP